MIRNMMLSIRNSKTPLALAITACCLFLFTNHAASQTANWIWHPDQAQGKVPVGDCYFRKTVEIKAHRSVMLKVAGNDKYEVYLNGNIVAVGETTEIKTFDVSSAVREGQNTLAVKVTNTDGNTAGFAAALLIKNPGKDQWKIIATDSTWKTHTRVISIWKKRVYNDQSWKLAKILAPGKSTAKRNQPGNRQSGTTTSIADQPRSVGQLQPATAKNNGRLTDATTNKNSLDIQFDRPLSPKIDQQPIPSKQVSSRKTARKDESSPKGQLQPKRMKQPPKSIPVVTREEKQRAEIKLGIPKMNSLDLLGKTRKNSSLTEGLWIAKEFDVKKIMDGKHGSFLAMAFNEFGQTLLSVEGKGLIMVDFTTSDLSKRVQKVADDVTNVQGILPINGTIFVTGDGSDGPAVYQLIDQDRDGYYEQAKTILKFRGKGGEHGAHGLRLGPDGLIYVVMGNASAVDSVVEKRSPYKVAYHGDLKKHYEDPGGHAAGVIAPGGTIIRMTIDGRKVEKFAGGIRNAYDLTFNEQGDLFVHDSDMEADAGAPWYRPNQFFHVIAGADLGWRRGWSKWPGYFVDAIPSLAGTGNGSPTGATCYRHVTFPRRYQNAIFLGDWLNGRISCAKITPQGATYKAEIEKFFEADGITITDLEVGPDGGLYFCTGGRGTEGGIYRIQWTGTVPKSEINIQSDVAQIVRMPQVDSAWAMQQRALLRQKMGESWNEAVYGIVDEAQNKSIYRLNAFNAMLLYGPRPGLEQLIKWSKDDNPEVRRAATAMLPTLRKKHSTDSELKQIRLTLIEQLQDSNAAVRRTACEMFLKMELPCDIDNLVRILKSDDWAEATVGRRLLETIPAKQWKDICFNTPDQKLFCQMATSLMTVEPKKANAYQILVRISKFAEGQIYDPEFLKMLRVAQLAMTRCDIDPQNIPAFAEWVSDEFPTKNGDINRELARLTAMLEKADYEERLVEYFQNSADSNETRLSVALHLQTLGDKLSAKERLALIEFIESQKTLESTGSSYPHYLAKMTTELAQSLSDSDHEIILKNGARWQNAALAVIYEQGKIQDHQIPTLIEVDQAIAGKTDAASAKLKLAIIAVLSESNQESAMDYLRKIWRRDRDRRSDVVIGLAQKPEGKNWPYLVSSIEQVDDDAVNEILEKLATVDRRPQQAKYYRQVLESGYRLRKSGAIRAARLLGHWAEKDLEIEEAAWQKTLDRWSDWYRETYPDEEPVSMPNQEKIGKWKTSQLLDFLENDKNIGNIERGKMIFAKANCADCHRYNGQGEIMGPDLSFVARRFSTRELLESILQPSKHISDQYAAHKIVTHQGEQLVGLMTRDRHGNVILLDSQGKKKKIQKDQIDEISESKTSAMPDHLLETLTEKDIADLFAFLNTSKRKSSSTAKTGAGWVR